MKTFRCDHTYNHDFSVFYSILSKFSTQPHTFILHTCLESTLCILNCLCEIETAAWKSNKNLLKNRRQFANQPRSQGSLLPVPTERAREKDPGWVWSRGSRTKLILREESFVSQFCVLFTQWSQGSTRAR